MRKTAAKVIDAVTTKATRRKRATTPSASEATTPAPVSETRPLVTHEMIAARAYQLYVARGGQHGHAAEDWARAERELTAN